MGDDDIEDLRTRLAALEKVTLDLHGMVMQLVGQTNMLNTLIKYVILPLIGIVGALVGFKIVLPSL